MDIQNFKPLLAGKFKTQKEKDGLIFPVLASPKLDGIRVVLNENSVALSRTLKMIPNSSIQGAFQLANLTHLDGEIVFGSPELAPDNDTFNKTTSAVMSQEGEPEVTYYVFDSLQNPEASFLYRYEEILHIMQTPAFKIRGTNVSVVRLQHVQLNSWDDIDDYEASCLAAGFEGIMLRKPEQSYKFGRSSASPKQQHLLKVKQFEDAEGEIIAFEEEMENTNEATVDNLGRTKRSSAKAGKVPKGTLGKVQVRILTGNFKGKTVRVGSGFKQAERQEIWDNQDDYLGKTITFQYQPHGSMEKPRIGTFKGFRKD